MMVYEFVHCYRKFNSDSDIMKHMNSSLICQKWQNSGNGGKKRSKTVGGISYNDGIAYNKFLLSKLNL